MFYLIVGALIVVFAIPIIASFMFENEDEE